MLYGLVVHPVASAAHGTLDRRAALALAVGALVSCAVVAVVDPNEPGRYPTCPTQAILGIDCPACGTLRGVHALTRGRVLEALDHNLLLLVAAPLAVLGVWRWAATGLGRPVRLGRWPAWALPVAVIVATVFAVARNLPVDALRWLDAAA